MRLLAVGNDPDVGQDARVVEHLIRQADDRVQVVVFDDPAPYLRLSGPRVSAKQRRAVEYDADAGAFVLWLPHLANHVKEEQQCAVRDTRQTWTEAASKAQVFV